MDFLFGPYHIDVNVEKTQEFYGQYDYFGCGCAGCNNFNQAIKQLPEDVRSFLVQFGVDPAKPAELSAIHSVDGKETLYGGYYHICGTILAGKNPFVQVAKKRYRLDDAYKIELSHDFSIHFTEDCVLVDKSFPAPMIQLNFYGDLPWVLDEPNPYT